jgi:hypothetical protein
MGEVESLGNGMGKEVMGKESEEMWGQGEEREGQWLARGVTVMSCGLPFVRGYNVRLSCGKYIP